MSRQPDHINRASASLFAVGLACLASCGLPEPPPHPAPADTPNARRAQDLDYLVEVIETIHPKPFLRTPESQFRAGVEAVRQAIPELDDAEFQVALARVLASLQDAHCGTWAFEASGYPIALPCQLEAFDEGYFVVVCAGDHPELLAARINSIDGQSYETLVDDCSDCIPAANSQRVAYKAPRMLMSPRFLHALGPGRDPGGYTVEFELPGGKRITREFLAGALEETEGLHVLSGQDELPWSIHPQQHETGAPYWWAHDPDDRILYLQYNAVETHDDYPFDQMVDEFLTRLDQGGVDAVVVDVRYSGGGNNGLIDPLDEGLASRARRGELDRLYVLVSGRTFSSGVDVAVRLRDHAGATIVGTDTGGMPNSFGNAVGFTLPNSGTEGWCSSGHFRLVDGEPSTLKPDVDLGRPWADYSTGRDTAMEWVRSQGTR